MSDTGAPLLEIRGLCVSYGHVQAVRDLSLKVRAGQVVTLIGPNGAGKTSTLGAVAGLFRPDAGQVLLEGRDVTGLPSHRAVSEGIVLVPHGWAGDANANLLTDITCREPIMGYPDQKSLQCRIQPG